MGRLGFNLVRQKEAAKGVASVESGATDQQNERNESVEIGELLLALEERNRTVKNLRLLLASLTTVIICLCAYIILVQWKDYHREAAVAKNHAKIEHYQAEVSSQMQALQGQYDALSAAKLEEAARNCTAEANNAELEKLKQALSEAKTRHESESREAESKYFVLQNSYESLQIVHEALTATCAKKEEEQLTELNKLQEERADLLRKVEASQRKLQQRQSRAPSTTTTTPTTTNRPRTLFDNNRMKKFNDLVREIESGMPMYNIPEFMKITDEVFGL